VTVLTVGATDLSGITYCWHSARVLEAAVFKK